MADNSFPPLPPDLVEELAQEEGRRSERTSRNLRTFFGIPPSASDDAGETRTASFAGVDLGGVGGVEVIEQPASLAGHDPTYGDIDDEGCAILSALVRDFRPNDPVVVENGYLRGWRPGETVHGYVIGEVATPDSRGWPRYRVRVRMPVYGPSPLQGAYSSHRALLEAAVEHVARSPGRPDIDAVRASLAGTLPREEFEQLLNGHWRLPEERVGQFDNANYASTFRNTWDARWNTEAGDIVENLQAVAEQFQTAAMMGYTPDAAVLSPLLAEHTMPSATVNCLTCRHVRREGDCGVCTLGVSTERVTAAMCCISYRPCPPLDLSPWPAAATFLKRFARCPWDWSPLLILADWLEERVAADTAGKLRTWIGEAQEGEHGRVFLAEIDGGKMTRTKRRAFIANVRARLRETFGDWDKEERERAIPF